MSTSLPSQAAARSKWLMEKWGRVLAASLVAIIAVTQFGTNGTPDFLQDYAAGWAWIHGQPVNSPTLELAEKFWPEHGFIGVRWLQQPHPPVATLVTLPLAYLPFVLARWCWAAIGVTALLAAWHVGRVPSLSALATTPLWCIAIVLGTLEPVLALCLAVCMRCADTRPRWAGLSLGLAIALKAYPAVFVAAVVILGLYRCALWACATAIGLTLLAECSLGWGTFAGWLDITQLNTAYYVDRSENSSLVRVVRVLLNWPPALIAAIIVAMLLTPLYLRRRTIDRRLGLQGVISVVLLASPLSWRHYVGLAGLGPLGGVQLSLTFVAGLAALLIGLDVIPSAPETVVQFPLILTLFWQWWTCYVKSPRPEAARMTPD